MQNSGLKRFDNIKLHTRCLIRITKLLLRKEISLPEYFKKGKFFIDGILRAMWRG